MKRLYPYDLQVQSSYSDGDFSPIEVARRARRVGLRGVVITDHNTIDGLGASSRALRRYRFSPLEGVELSTTYAGAEAHILGYAFHFKPAPLRSFLRPVQRLYSRSAASTIASLRRQGFTAPPVTRLAKRRRGRGGCVIPYDIVRATARQNKQSFDEMRAAVRRAWREGSAPFQSLLPSAREAIQAIHRAGGVAVLAHPGRGGKDVRAVRRTVAALQRHGLDGVEAITPRHTRQQNRDVRQLARMNGLIVTGGSDYHGPLNQPNIELGDGGLHAQDYGAFLEALRKVAGAKR